MSVFHKINAYYIFFGLVFVVGFLARIYDINFNFDGDEVFSVKLASTVFTDVIAQSLADSPHPPLHNVLLFSWINIFGKSEAAARSLSIVFSALFLSTAFLFFRKFADKWISCSLVLILAVSPIFVFYGQQARPYSLIAFLSCLNLLMFSNVMDDARDRKALALWALSCALLLYAQYMGVLIVAAEMLVAFMYLRQGRAKVFVYGFAGCAAILPWMLAAMGSSVLVGADPLPHISWMQRPQGADLLWHFISVFGSSSLIQVRWLVLVMLGVGLAYAWKGVATRKLPAMHALLLIIGFGIPVFVFMVSVVGPKPVFATRQLLGSAFACIAMLGVCLTALRGPVAFGLIAFFLAWTVSGFPESLPHANARPPWKAMAGFIDGKYGERLVLAQEGWVQSPLEYYRASGPVRVLGEFSGIEDAAAFVCRSSRCSAIEEEQGEGRAVLVKTMPWGREESGLSLQLFEIRAGAAANASGTPPDIGAQKGVIQ